MSRIEEIRQELNAIAERVAILGKEVNEIESKSVKPSRWYSPEECNYFVSGLTNEVEEVLSINNRDILSKQFLGFPTKGDAEFYRDIPRLMRPLAKALRELNEGWWPDWKDITQEKWYMYYDHSTNKWRPRDTARLQDHHSALYAKSRKIMEQALEIAQLDAPV